MSDDYDVGYAKPPKQHRFQKGNQAARGKRATKPRTIATISMPDILETALSTRKRVRRGDQVQDMRVADVFVENVIRMAMSGSTRDAVKLTEWLDRYAPKMLQQRDQRMTVMYVAAAGSNVPLPPADLWER